MVQHPSDRSLAGMAKSNSIPEASLQADITTVHQAMAPHAANIPDLAQENRMRNRNPRERERGSCISPMKLSG